VRVDLGKYGPRSVRDCADVDAACAYLRRKGIDVSEPVVRDYGMKQLYLNDPDGYEICFQCPVS
jgi:catechol 2,3-dioxygenase-like lactoylglutathione lyase family enzyme